MCIRDRDNTAYPHQVVIDLGKEYNVTGFRILPRAEQGAPGMIKAVSYTHLKE